MTTINSTPHDRAADFTDAVVAAYIHEISARDRDDNSGSRFSQRGNSPAGTSRRVSFSSSAKSARTCAMGA